MYLRVEGGEGELQINGIKFSFTKRWPKWGEGGGGGDEVRL